MARGGERGGGGREGGVYEQALHLALSPNACAQQHCQRTFGRARTPPHGPTAPQSLLGIKRGANKHHATTVLQDNKQIARSTPPPEHDRHQCVSFRTLQIQPGTRLVAPHTTQTHTTKAHILAINQSINQSSKQASMQARTHILHARRACNSRGWPGQHTHKHSA